MHLHIFLTIFLLLKKIVVCLYNFNQAALIKITHNIIFVNKNKKVTLRIIAENNRGHFINLHNIITVNNIGRIEIHKTFLRLINMESKNKIVTVTLIVKYQSLPENIFPKLLMNPYRNITRKIELFNMVVQ